MNLEWLTLFIIALVLRLTPYIGVYFKTFNTLIHEIGHGLMTMIFNGRVVSIRLFKNTEGVAETLSANRLSTFFISIAGYTFSSIFSFFSFYLIHHGFLNEYSKLILFILFFSLIAWIRNIYGIFWSLSFFFLLLLSDFFLPELLFQRFIMVLVFVLLIESVYTAYIILRLSIKRPKQAGDATNLRKITFLPAAFWGLFFFLQSLFVAYYVVVTFIAISL